MGHRASVAYLDGDTVRAHYSHWGANGVKLLDAFDEDQPHAGGNVDYEPYWEGESLHAWAREALDFVFHEAAYVVDEETWEVRAFAPIRCPSNDEDGSPQQDRGALVEVADADEYHDAFCSEYDWFESDDVPEEKFATRLHEEYGDRIPEFSQYHDPRDS